MTTHTSPLLRVVLPALLGGILVGAALAGCSATAGAPSGTAASASRPSGSTATTSTAPIFDADGICRDVSVDAANAAMHVQPAFTAQASSTWTNNEPECGFTTADQSLIVNVTVFDTSVTPFTLKNGAVTNETLHSVSGVGDRAAFGEYELDVVVGSKGVVVQNLGDAGAVSLEQLEALAKLFIAKL